MSPVSVSSAYIQRTLSAVRGSKLIQILVSRKGNLSSPVFAKYEDTFSYGLIQELKRHGHVSLFLPSPPRPPLSLC